TRNTKHVTQILRKKPHFAIVAAGNLDDMRSLPKIYQKYKIPYIYDPGQALPALSEKDLIAGLTGAEVFICNDYELAMTLKKTGLTKKKLLDRVEVLITTLGEKGSVIEVGKISNFQFPISNSRIDISPAKPKNICDPTGAGDAYRAGLIKGLLLGLPIDKIGKLASVVSVYTVEKYGTQTHWFNWLMLIKRYRENFKEELL
ncbi:MAG: PfkB family carbohydrate kinase, partial [bacterium]|nr:PfkB family carbohydrate kinase [bacterium]